VPASVATLGATHPTHGSPYVAGFVQTAIATAIVLWFFFTGRDPYGQLYALMAILGTAAITDRAGAGRVRGDRLLPRREETPGDRPLVPHLRRPLVGGLGMLYVIWLLVQSAGVAAGSATGDIVFQDHPVDRRRHRGRRPALRGRRQGTSRRSANEIIGRWWWLDDSQERG